MHLYASTSWFVVVISVDSSMGEGWEWEERGVAGTKFCSRIFPKHVRRSLPLAAFVDCLGSRGLVELLGGDDHLFVKR